ncbi:MAG: hypothetical protein LBU80_02215 [Rikenellaceae bacterium]|jgi:hypothetical protein|nr:hypothetical protein [Rikenellaceae bacterium]
MNPRLLLFASFLPLGVMIRSDFRERQVGVLALVFFASLQFGYALLSAEAHKVLLNLTANLGLIGLAGGALWIFLHVLRPGDSRQMIGAGDGWFIVALAPLFELRGYVFFLTAAFLLSLGWWWVVGLLRRRPDTIPLVGTVGVCFLCYALALLFR